MIEARGLTKRFGSLTAVDAIDLSIDAGRVVGVLGHNGAGKSTTIRMLTGALRPTSGSIQIAGVDVVADPREAARRVGYLPESTPLYTEMRVSEFLGFRARVYGMGRSTRSGAIDRALEMCQLGEVRRRPIHQLSKGYRQRVGLAGALLHEPQVLILDEPTVGLDPSQVMEFRRLIRSFAGSQTVLLSTHILSEVEAVCDEVVLIARGRLRASGCLESLRVGAGARYVVEASDRSAYEALRALPGSAQHTSETLRDAWVRVTIEATPDAGDLREAIARAVRDRDGSVLLRRLERQSNSLESLFAAVEIPTEAGISGEGAA